MDSTTAAGIFKSKLGLCAVGEAECGHCKNVRSEQRDRAKAQNGEKPNTTSMKMQMWVAVAAVIGIIVGYGFGKSQAKPQSKAPLEHPQWIGRFVGGDGQQHIFTAPNITVGLRSDGVLAWKYQTPDPISLISTQQAEAKK